jgi:hypothetical protein
MRIRVGVAALLGAAILASGCALALPGYNTPFSEKIVVLAPDPSAISVQIEDSGQGSLSVVEDGRVVVEFPVLPRECSTYLLGVRLRDRSVEARKIIHLVRDGRIVRKLSVNQLRRLPLDQQGFHRLRVR